MINNASINVVVLVRKLKQHLLKAPNHVKHAKKVEASTLFYRGVQCCDMAMIVIIFDVCNVPYCKLATGRSHMVVFNLC